MRRAVVVEVARARVVSVISGRRTVVDVELFTRVCTVTGVVDEVARVADGVFEVVLVASSSSPSSVVASVPTRDVDEVDRAAAPVDPVASAPSVDNAPDGVVSGAESIVVAPDGTFARGFPSGPSTTAPPLSTGLVEVTVGSTPTVGAPAVPTADAVAAPPGSTLGDAADEVAGLAVDAEGAGSESLPPGWN